MKGRDKTYDGEATRERWKQVRDLVRPIVEQTYGKGIMAMELVAHLTEKICAYSGVDRTRMMRVVCWDWFSGGSTAQSVADRIEAALSARGIGDA